MEAREIELAKNYSDLIDRSEDGLVEQCFIAGYEAATKWKKVEKENPDNDRTVLVRIRDCRRLEDNVTEVSLGYYDEFKNWRYQCTDNLINSGHGWFIEEWIEIPQ